MIGVCFRAMKRLLLLIPFALLLAGCGGTSGGTGNPNQGHLGETAGVIGSKVTIRGKLSLLTSTLDKWWRATPPTSHA